MKLDTKTTNDSKRIDIHNKFGGRGDIDTWMLDIIH